MYKQTRKAKLMRGGVSHGVGAAKDEQNASLDPSPLPIDAEGNIIEADKSSLAEASEHGMGDAAVASKEGVWEVPMTKMTKRPSDSEAHGGGTGDPEEDEERTLSAEEQVLKDSIDISPDFARLQRQLEEKVGLHKSFDVIFREMEFGGQLTGIFYYNGFAKDTVLTDILTRLSYADDGHRDDRNAGTRVHHKTYAKEREKTENGKSGVIQRFGEALIPHIQVKTTKSLKEVIDNVAMGCTAFFFEGEREAILVDAKNFPVRSTEEPDLERVVRGSRDGFVETLLTNVTLVRRRLRDPRLKLEITQVGKRTQTDICLGYIEDICDMDLVESIKDKLKEVQVDGLPLAEKQLEEALIGKGWNPYPMVRYSERPDVVSAHLLEGHLIIFVDTSPSVMILPTTFFHHVQHAEEYRQTPMVGSYLRWVRFLGIAASLFLLPLWFLIVTTPELKPVGLEFIGPQKNAKIPLLGQFMIAELGIDLMRMAAVHTPTPLATAMGLVAAILIGDVAVKTGLFVNEVVLYLAAAAIGTFATPSYELSLANRLARLGLLLAAAFFKAPGLIIASTALVVLLAVQRSYNTPYLWPLLPFNAKAMFSIILRRPFLSSKTRMSLTKATDTTRQPQ